MRITTAQLRQIIKEEVMKGVVKEFQEAPREEGGVPSWMISVYNQLMYHAKKMMFIKAQRQAALEVLKSLENLTEAMRTFDENQGEDLYQKVSVVIEELEVFLVQDEKDDIDTEENDDFMQESRKRKQPIRRR